MCGAGQGYQVTLMSTFFSSSVSQSYLKSLRIPDTFMLHMNIAPELSSTFAMQLPRSLIISDVVLLACTAEERMQKLYQRSMFHLLREDGQLAPALHAKVTVVEVIHHYLTCACAPHTTLIA